MASSSPTGALVDSATPSATSDAACLLVTTLTVSDPEVSPGAASRVTVTGQPGDQVTVTGYSRPSTTAVPLRATQTIPQTGQLDYVFHPTTNTRLYAMSQHCLSGTAVIRVRLRLSLAALRLGPGHYRFTGLVSPSTVNQGRLVVLRYRYAGRSLPKATTTVTGTGFSTEVMFLGRGAFVVYADSPGNTVNAAGSSEDPPATSRLVLRVL